MKTKEEILLKHGIDIAEFDEYERIEDCLFINKSHAQLLYIKKAMQEYAEEYSQQQLASKEEEIEKLKNIAVEFYWWMQTSDEAYQAQRKMMSPKMGGEDVTYNKKIVSELFTNYLNNLYKQI